MDKIKAVFFILIFLCFLGFGFVLAREVSQGLFPQQTPTLQVITPSSNQVNLLVIQADDLTVPTPALTGAWMVFITYFEDQPFISFKLVYPTSDQQVASSLMRAFSYRNLEPAPEFLAELQKFDIRWNGYVVMDQSAVNQLTYFYAAQFPDGRSSAGYVDGDNELLISQQAQWVHYFCGFLNQQDGDRSAGFSSFTSQVPTHVQTNLDSDMLLTTWGRLSNPQYPPHCEVIGN